MPPVVLNGIFTGGVLQKQGGASTNDNFSVEEKQNSNQKLGPEEAGDASVAHQVTPLMCVAFEHNVCLLAH